MSGQEDNPAGKGTWDRAALLAALGVVALIALAVGVVGWFQHCRRMEIQREARECMAMYACTRIGGGQSIYHRTDWEGDGVLEYAGRFPLLYFEKDAEGQLIRLISEALARATGPDTALHGYWFVDMAADRASGPYADESGNQTDDFGVCAVPARYPRSGRMTYIMDTTCTVYEKDNGGKPVTVFPPSPRAEEWRAADYPMERSPEVRRAYEEMRRGRRE